MNETIRYVESDAPLETIAETVVVPTPVVTDSRVNPRARVKVPRVVSEPVVEVGPPPRIVETPREPSRAERRRGTSKPPFAVPGAEEQPRKSASDGRRPKVRVGKAVARRPDPKRSEPKRKGAKANEVTRGGPKRAEPRRAERKATEVKRAQPKRAKAVLPLAKARPVAREKKPVAKKPARPMLRSSLTKPTSKKPIPKKKRR